jgi:hypothetical protein
MAVLLIVTAEKTSNPTESIVSDGMMEFFQGTAHESTYRTSK